MRKKISFIFLNMAIAICICSCGKTEDSTYPSGDNGLNFAQTTNETTKGSDKTEITPNKMPKYSRPGYTVKNSNMYTMGEIIQEDGIKFSISNILTSKDLPDGIKKEDANFLSEEIDENGKLLQQQSYIFVNLTMENTTGEMTELYLDLGRFIEVNEEGEIIDSSQELLYRSEYDSGDSTKKDYYRYELSGLSESTVRLGYVINDEMISSGRLFYLIDKNGVNAGNDKLKAFKIELIKE